MTNKPSVTMKFWILEGGDNDDISKAEPTHQKSFSQHDGTAAARIGLPEGQEPTKVRLFGRSINHEELDFSKHDLNNSFYESPIGTQPDAGSYDYSGMHDHGPMIPPLEGGAMAQLLGCVQDSKKHSDEYLTQIIQEEKKKANSNK